MKKKISLLILSLIIALLAISIIGCNQVSLVATFFNGTEQIASMTSDKENKIVQPYFDVPEGKQVIGWYTSADFLGEAFDFKKDALTQDTNLYVKLSDIFCNVSYNLAYQTANAVPTQENVYCNTSITLAAAPVRKGYNFTGWSDGNQIYSAGAAYTVTDSCLFFATWRTETVTVTFIDDDGITVLETQTIPYGSNAAIPKIIPDSVDGWFFSYWFGQLTNITSDVTIVAYYAPCYDTDDTFSYTVNNTDNGYIVSIKPYDWENYIFPIIPENLVFPDEHLGVSCTEIAELAFSWSFEPASITIPSSYRVIHNAAFRSMPNVSSITISEGVKVIGDCVFDDMSSLSEITFPASLEKLGVAQFVWNENLKNIFVAESNKFFCDIDGVLFDKNVTKLICYPRSHIAETYTLPSTVTTLEPCSIIMLEANYNTETDTNVPYTKNFVFDAGVEVFPEGIFSGCNYLENLTLPSTLKTIGSNSTKFSYGLDDDTFEGFGCLSFLSHIKEIILPEGLTFIGSNCLKGLGGSEKGNTILTICSTLQEIGEGALSAMSFGVKEIILNEGSTLFSLLNGVLFDFDLTTLICYPHGLNAASYIIPDGVTKIWNSAFWSNDYLETVTVPEGVTKISDGTFNAMKNLTTLNLPSTLLEIGERAPMNKIAGVLTLFTGTFTYSPKLQNINYPNGCNVEFFGYGTFAFSMRETLEIPASVTELFMPFIGMTSLTSFTVEEGSQSFMSQDGVLYSLDGLTLVAYPLGKTETIFAVPEGVTAIGIGAFIANTTLQEIILPSTLKRLETGAFNSCTFSSITLPASIEYIGANVFDGNNNLTSVTILSLIPPQLFEEVYIYQVFNGADIYVPAEALDTYIKAWPDLNWYIKAISE